MLISNLAPKAPSDNISLKVFIMNKKEIASISTAACLILAIGLTIGFSVGYYNASRNAFPGIKEVGEQNPKTPTIRLLRFQGGQLHGEVAGAEVRLAYDTENILSLAPGEEFQIPAYEISLYQYYSARDLPEGTNYIASKSGKYYYNVLDTGAFRITPKNRLYFKDRVEAENMGYKPRD